MEQSKNISDTQDLPLHPHEGVEKSQQPNVPIATDPIEDQADSADQPSTDGGEVKINDSIHVVDDSSISTHQPAVDGEANLTGSLVAADSEADSALPSAIGDGEIAATDPVQVSTDKAISGPQSAAEREHVTVTDPSPATGNQIDSSHKPAVRETATDTLAASAHQPAAAGENERDMATTVDLVAPKKKKKRKPKSKAKHGKGKPTGYEEYYVDAPMTPKEYQEEKALYDISRPLIHRVEEALLRYQKNRRMEPERHGIFMRYLAYGGVDVSPKMFAGVDERGLQQLDSEQVLIVKGQTNIPQECEKLPVDFNAVVKGYLTSYFPYFFSPETEDMVKLATVTIRNFLSYLLYHDVCPEYKENIEEARKSCDIATKELWQNQQFAALTPGDFNKGCSTLFGGFFFNVQIEDNNWNKQKDSTFLMQSDVARKVVKFGIAGAGTNEQALLFQQLATQNALHCVLLQDIHGFEVTAVHPPAPDVCLFYQQHAPDLIPVGKLIGKPYRDPGKPPYDLSADERLALANETFSGSEFEFFLEEDLLRLCYPGMKVITPVWKLNSGLHFFEDVHTVYCSIYTVLSNDLMLNWKKPVALTAGSQDDVGNTEVNEDGFEEEEKAL